MPDVKNERDVGFLWRALVVGLLVLLVASLGGIIYTVVANKSSTALVGVFTTILSGLLALFVASPNNSSNRR